MFNRVQGIPPTHCTVGLIYWNRFLDPKGLSGHDVRHCSRQICPYHDISKLFNVGCSSTIQYIELGISLLDNSAVFQDSKFIQQINPRVTAVCDALNTWLDDTCLAAIRDTRSGHGTNQLSRCLRIYATIDRVENIERLVREEIVKVTDDCKSQG